MILPVLPFPRRRGNVRAAVAVGLLVAGGTIVGLAPWGTVRAAEPPVAEVTPGQDDLDAAVDAKLAANSLDDFEKVLELVRSALRKGLDEKSRKFANDLYTGTLVDRASMIGDALFQGPPEGQQQWERMRAFALRDLGEVVQRDDALAAAQVMVARLEALPGGDRRRALAAARRAIEIDGDDPLQTAQAHVVLGNLADDDAEERRAQYDKAVELAPRDVDVRRTRGLFQLMQGDEDAAIADFDVAIEEKPDDIRLREVRGLALLMAKRPDEALETFDKALAIDPASADILFQRGRLFASQGDLPKALADLDAAIDAAPDAAEPLVLRARLRQQGGDGDAAKRDLERALSRHPDHPSALELRGLIAADRGDYPAAIADFRRLVRQAPEDATLVGQLGLLYLAAKQPREAIRRFSRALEIDPGQFLSFRGRSDAAISVGDHAAALVDLERAMELQPDNSGVLNNLAWLLATSPDDALRDGKRAIGIATKACETTEWQQPHIVSTLAAAYAETGDFDQARTFSQKAVEGSDEESEVRKQLEAELASYEAGKPWRERQDMEGGAGPDQADETTAATEAAPVVQPGGKAAPEEGEPARRAGNSPRRPFDD